MDSLARCRLGDFNAFSNVTAFNEAIIASTFAGKIEYGTHLDALTESCALSIASEIQNNFAINVLCGLNQT